MNKSIFLVPLLLAVVSCASSSYQSASAPISQDAASRVSDGVDTKTDVIAMFGSPNGFVPTAGTTFSIQNPVEIPGDLLGYKDCVVKSAAELDGARTAAGVGAAAAVTVLTGGIGLIAAPWLAGSATKNSTIEECQLFAALLNGDDIVIAHGYVGSNIFSAEQVAQIQEDKSSKSDVVRTMSLPTTVTHSGESEIYTYKNCFVSGGNQSSYTVHSAKRETHCQQSSFVIDKSSGVVDRVTYIPFPEK